MAVKRYRSAPKTAREPFEFEIMGQHFRCVPFVTVASLHRLITASKNAAAAAESAAAGNGDDAGDRASSTLDAMFQFIRATIVKEDRDRFFGLLDDENFDIELEEVLAIGGDMVEHYSGDRPTGEPSSTTPSSQSTGVGSTDGSYQAAQTYSRSQPTEGLTS